MTTVNLTSDELAEDYKASLEDLSFNSRYEISNLTVIARENIHAAQAIARTLEQHIANVGTPGANGDCTSPARKLPALYLLDSIAKNVGTPYTLFFQRNLFSTFMDAYLVVDPPVRRKLEEMLQTWKQPSPGSTSQQPCFAPDTTRKIDNALIKARTAALQYQQKQRQNQAALGLDRQPSRTNTPPQGAMRNGPPPPPSGYSNGNQFDYNRSGQHGNAMGANNNHHSNTNSQAVMSGQMPHSQHPLQAPPQSMGGSVDTLQSDISRLIESCRNGAVREPGNVETQQRLQALMDLRHIIQTQHLPEAQLAQVREQVRALSNRTPPPPPPPPPPPQLQMPSFTTQDLASLLATTTASQTISLPLAPQPAPRATPLPLSLPNLPPPPPPAPPASFGSNGTDAASLFASLKSAGLLPGLAGGIPPPPPPGQLPFPLPGNMPASLPGLPPFPGHQQMNRPQTNGPTFTHTGKKDWRSIDVELNTQSLKIPRPHLYPTLNEVLPKKCHSCARRFENSSKGTMENRAHLDWHFRVSQRMLESQKRGQNRSWYVGEEEWIRTSDDGEDIASASANPTSSDPRQSAAAAAAARTEELKKQYVVVPDASETHRVCPICQEELKYVWHDETDEFVWMDAKSVGGRIYHASCHAEASLDRATGGGSRSGTPDAAGVKRKADHEMGDPRIKIKKEVV